MLWTVTRVGHFALASALTLAPWLVLLGVPIWELGEALFSITFLASSAIFIVGVSKIPPLIPPPYGIGMERGDTGYARRIKKLNAADGMAGTSLNSPRLCNPQSRT